mmetsp:Transcript_9868/g.12307  ORF Transcript_9868/g.12307 Transcript_9868/m.12307 type:complete len:126 (-) Transcript_9868:255-632(-)
MVSSISVFILINTFTRKTALKTEFKLRRQRAAMIHTIRTSKRETQENIRKSIERLSSLTYLEATYFSLFSVNSIFLLLFLILSFYVVPVIEEYSPPEFEYSEDHINVANYVASVIGASSLAFAVG